MARADQVGTRRDLRPGFAFTPDNKSVWVGTSLNANAARLLQIDVATGAQKVVAADPQFDLHGLITQPKTNELEVVTFVKQRMDYDFIDPKIKADYEVLRKASHGDITDLSRSLDDKQWIVTYVSDDGPVSFYLYDRPSKKATLLFAQDPRWKSTSWRRWSRSNSPLAMA